MVALRRFLLQSQILQEAYVAQRNAKGGTDHLEIVPRTIYSILMNHSLN